MILIILLARWEQKNGVIRPGSIVLMRTGWGQRWGDVRSFLGEKKDPVPEEASPAEGNTVKIGNLDLNFPGFDASAAKLLTSERGVLGVGSDAISIDAGANSRVR